MPPTLPGAAGGSAPPAITSRHLRSPSWQTWAAASIRPHHSSTYLGRADRRMCADCTARTSARRSPSKPDPPRGAAAAAHPAVAIARTRATPAPAGRPRPRCWPSSTARQPAPGRRHPSPHRQRRGRPATSCTAAPTAWPADPAEGHRLPAVDPARPGLRHRPHAANRSACSPGRSRTTCGTSGERPQDGHLARPRHARHGRPHDVDAARGSPPQEQHHPLPGHPRQGHRPGPTPPRPPARFGRRPPTGPSNHARQAGGH